MSETRTVAVLGTGIMGAAMARNLLRAGHAVRVWNRSAAKAEPLMRFLLTTLCSGRLSSAAAPPAFVRRRAVENVRM